MCSSVLTTDGTLIDGSVREYPLQVRMEIVGTNVSLAITGVVGLKVMKTSATDVLTIAESRNETIGVSSNLLTIDAISGIF